jgi:hypothetical protein
VGLDLEHLSEQLARRPLDGSSYFPVELVGPASHLMTFDSSGFRRISRFGWTTRVDLIPILRTPDDCEQIADSGLVADCQHLNLWALAELQQELLPMYFAGMQRKDVLPTDPDARQSNQLGYLAAYERPTVPPLYAPIVVVIDQFSDAQTAKAHFDDIMRFIPNYNPGAVVEDEVIPGEKVKRIATPENSRAFWVSENRLILLTFMRPSDFDQNFTMQWLLRNPSTMDASPTNH